MNRAEYMAGSGADMSNHRAYYGQFVNDRTISYVVNIIGGDRILASTDHPHMNDIPLGDWDDLTHFLPLAVTFKSLGDCATLAGLVCVAKEAARQWKEAHD